MAYLLEQTNQVTILRPLLSEISETVADLFIITSDGETVETHKLLFSLYSQLFTNILEDMKSQDMVVVSVPMPSVIVRNMIRILTEGRAYGYHQDHLLEVSHLGSLLGIQFTGLQVGSRKNKQVRIAANIKLVDTVDDVSKQTELSETQPKDEVTVKIEQEGQQESSMENCKIEEGEEVFVETVLDVSDNDIKQKEHSVIQKWEGWKWIDDENSSLSLILEKKIECPECGKKFRNSQLRNKHLRRQHPALPPAKVECKECDKTFSSSQSLQNHSRLHTGEKPYSCDFCEKAFYQKGNMLDHKLTHDKESEEIRMKREKRKVKCSDCGSLCASKAVLKSHKASVHSDATPFKCEKCDKSFKLSNGLRLHMVRHSDERLFECMNCNHWFKRKSELDKHNIKQICLKKDLVQTSK